MAMDKRGVLENESLISSGKVSDAYFDQFGKRRWEKADSKSIAIKLYGKRKQQVLEGKKLPELFRKPSVNFSQLIDDALAYSKRNKRSYKTDVPRFASLKEWFGSHPAEELIPKDIEKYPGTSRRKAEVGALYFQSLSLADVRELSPGDSKSESELKSRSFRDASSRGQQPRTLSDRRGGKEASKGD